MYESFYGFKEKPFNLLPDPEYLYMSQGHVNAYTHLEYAIVENKGFVVITGEIGSGKTTLINYLLGEIGQNIKVGLITNTNVSPTQFVKMICQEFELKVEGMDKAEVLGLFYGFLLRQFAERNRVALIIDEAQNLTAKTMEEIRMLSNLESEKQHLIQMILVGQPELKHKLQRRDLEQFAQRVTVHWHLDGLKREEVDGYIRYRLKIGGAENLDIFDKSAIEAVTKYARGIPRLINILCDTALVYGYADGLKVLDKKVIEDVLKAREAGGIFTHIDRDDETDSKVLPIETPISEQLENRLQLMEGRIRELENKVGNIDQKINLLAQKRNERDIKILKILKMLKNRMESRRNVPLRFNQFKKKKEIAQTKALESEKIR